MIEESLQYDPEVVFKTILWIFTPQFTVEILNLFLGQIDDDDDDDFGGGHAIPAYLPSGA